MEEQDQVVEVENTEQVDGDLVDLEHRVVLEQHKPTETVTKLEAVVVTVEEVEVEKKLISKMEMVHQAL